ncbi:MAG: flavin reductase family protein [Alkalibacterium gilvum]|uniref:NADH-FMN oxidoreductase RutF, flavin reductase (DIM6/NTAB) family n=1 Tax=Alkalibacterium gilvum TaxID=1130080 RepID=A0A1H6U1E7_9LACT|nr:MULTISPECIES: flavin reductase family protein [Alkalibacterium]MDN6293917.1 flavin reductase family protein [Alkalibacterium sp.]MDN6295763.1 flavin reductase family protein [Alkalibacterium sp.]MDN6398341.1 flavin reductase family protein [Alkalibacterium sp.]MDN6729449.1 flavin reductase family protein [Alkalibacterium sp.]SEI86188.1 NADH-FMN oxidoreductase RutF, flavin reductase (DIM6/NTAB) family [Alkalibacterium gilvum]
MLNFSPNELTAKEKKKFLIGSVIPRPIALVSTRSNKGIVNIAPFSYFNIVTYDPPIFSIAVQRTETRHKDTARNIFENQEAVVHIVDANNVEAANQTSTPLDADESELDISDFTTIDSQTVRVPGLNEAKVRYETKLYDSMVIYNEQNEPTADLLLLKVKHYHIDKSIYKNGYIDPLKLNAVSRLAGDDYAEVGRIFPLERP